MSDKAHNTSYNEFKSVKRNTRYLKILAVLIRLQPTAFCWHTQQKLCVCACVNAVELRVYDKELWKLHVRL